MLRMIKFLKPYWISVLAVIALLFVQAMSELSLPNYMSDIVNVGIQQGGVENAVPQAVRTSQMEKLTMFMTDEERQSVLGAYTLVDQTSPDYSRLVKRYPLLESEAVYVLNDLTDEKIEALNPVIGKALLVVFTIDDLAANPEKASAMAGQFGFDLSKLPPGTDAYSLLKSLPVEQFAAMKNAIDQKFSSMDNSMITQSAAAAVRAEYVAVGGSEASLQTAYVLRIGGIMLLFTLLIAVCVIIISLLSSRIAAGVARDMRREVFTKVESFSKTEFEGFSTASLITRCTNDITQIQGMIVMSLRMVFFAPMMGIGAIIRAVQNSPSMTWIIGLGVVVLLSLIVTVFSIALPKFQRVQKLIDRLNLVTRENLSGLMVIRAFNTQKFELERFDKANQDLTGNMLFIGRVMVAVSPLMTFIMSGLQLLIIWVGGHLVANSVIQVGDMMAFLQYAMHVVFSFLMISLMFIILPRAFVSLRRVSEVLEVEPAIKDPEHPKKFDEKLRGQVEFRNVSFRYPGAEENVLCNISFTARPGETTAIIGSTGSGKSTVVNLIPRFFDVTEGSVLVDGCDVREVSQSDLRDRIGYIPQRGMLFSGTVESNLRYADENATPEELQKAVEIAQASDFIAGMEGGMSAPISQGGTNVSGGQKQRLAIARALVKKPPIYIFDDALSALDFKTDAALRRALKKETENSTMIIVTQRVSTIRNAEQIIVIDEGQIVGKGTHTELMNTCETYREMVSSQLSREELLS